MLFISLVIALHQNVKHPSRNTLALSGAYTEGVIPWPQLIFDTPILIYQSEGGYVPLPKKEVVVASSIGTFTPIPTQEILSAIAQYPWPLEQAISVANCESRLNPLAHNASGATGLFQIIGDNPAMFDVETNVAAAYQKYLDGVHRGNPWYHWNQFGSCGHFD